MLKQRIITALIMLPLAVLIIFFLPLDYFAWAVAVLITVGAWEWSPMAGIHSRFGKALLALLTFAVVAAVQLWIPASRLWEGGQPAPLHSLLTMAGSIWWIVATVMVVQYPQPRRFWCQQRRWKLVIGALTLLPTWAALLLLRSWRYDANPLNGAWAILFVLLLVWAADTGAYFSGRALGRHKLSPRVSPNKTIEGAIGGLVLAMAVAALCVYLRPAHLSAGAIITASVLAALASILGDLSESMFKRAAGIKDSGTILPGHGGILDRIDSITAAAPVFVLVMLVMGV
ncbi:phosphatidate cytidylyltransferase [Gallaecimonas sp. GXIMD1310]|uniref:phosphatidate cytidylyltransferase n=1 Tax=Gallaecimonas sp. GXIMD1310 TaxID=3131926 RepID=UPI003245AF43